MSLILDQLPGIPLPLPEISRQLLSMWKVGGDSSAAAPSEFRASQLNLVVHLGPGTSPSEAEGLLQQAIVFTQTHPGRIVLLSPLDPASKVQGAIPGKLFTQCYIGQSQREMCCCEALMMDYDPKEPQSLVNQVSVWVESDLPVYHWFHRVPSSEVRNKYLNFVKSSRRILYDSSIEDPGYAELPIPESWRLRDLADARLLPVKQSVGQILSTFPAEQVFDGLRTIKVQSPPALQSQALQLQRWLLRCVSQAESAVADRVNVEVELRESGPELSALGVHFIYQNDQHFSWLQSPDGTFANTQFVLAGRAGTHCMPLRSLDAKEILSEAIFFGRN
jgi:hypothetical protein